MSSEEIRQLFLEFFEKKGHKIVPSSSLIPDDPSVLLTTAGMQQFKPYLTGEIDPISVFRTKTVFSIQKSFRTTDIDEVGDKTHNTFFEMVGNFSFGGYFKEGAIPLSFEFLTSREGLGLDPRRLFITAFKGDNEVPRDDEAIRLWQEQFKKVGIAAPVGERIFLYGREKNWWEAGLGPAGPDAEMFYDLGTAHDPKFGPACHPNCDCGRFIEIGNDVFIQYNKTADGLYKPLTQKAIDNGRGFERLVMIMQKKNNIFETDLFLPLISKIGELKPKLDARIFRILADHLRASIFLIADGVRPSNKEAGYILRRLLRRILAYSVKYDIHADLFPASVEIIKEKFGEIYPEVKETKTILEVLEEEKQKFQEAIGKGVKEIEKLWQIDKKGIKPIRPIHEISGKDAFYLYETFGLPFELIKELAPPEAIKNLSKEDFDKEFEKHQELSRTASAGMFKGGLVDTSEQTIKLHTAAHLLMESLRRVLGNHVMQKGSNINAERLRLDFSHPGKLTPEQIKQIEDMVNEKIKQDLPVICEEMTLEEAKAQNATGVFEHKYGEKVKVYSIGDFSKEICGGPHVQKTGELGHFKIIKEEASSSGVRRIKAILD